MSQHKSGVLLGRAKMEAKRTYTNETGVIVDEVLKLDGYESSYNFYQLSQQKSKSILRELEWRLTKPFQVKFDSIVDEELIWRLKIS